MTPPQPVPLVPPTARCAGPTGAAPVARALARLRVKGVAVKRRELQGLKAMPQRVQRLRHGGGVGSVPLRARRGPKGQQATARQAKACVQGLPGVYGVYVVQGMTA